MHSNTYTIFFTSIMTIILGIILSTVSGKLKATQEEQVENDSKKNILISLGYVEPFDNPWTSTDIKNIFERNIETYLLDTLGNRKEKNTKSKDNDEEIRSLPLYLKKENGKIGGYAIPISGKGLWSTLYGYFAIEPDGSTVKGITFYKHKETPGLGGEVDKHWFQNNFIGKKFVDPENNLVGIKVLKGKVDPNNKTAYHQVDGISGATITSKGLENFLLNDLKKYDLFFQKIRDRQG
ncbi:MAG: NADH:ubiquinone reductase (Na(+)-transporting) subunit C [Candidatus Marinimicrobia bacterium]|nr:NADH:ubiquinone reductase (Na(+)-transporting) subunit C [Candidatus Neomarinimicrobiota bacterium]